MLIEKVVVNSSPLIVLFRSGLSYLFPKLFSSIIVPEQVYEEVVLQGKADTVANELSKTYWIERRAIEINVSIAAWNLGPGESAVFSIALQDTECTAIVDDLAARRCSKLFGIRTIGTGGLLVLAKQKGIIQSVIEPIEKLRQSGLYLSENVVDILKAKSGES